MRITHGDAASRWLIDIDDWHGSAIGLTPIINSPIVQTPKPLAALSVHREVNVSEISVPGTSPQNPLTSIATDGSAAIGVVGGNACDLAKGLPLHESGNSPVLRVAMGRFGLILMTGDGRLGVIRNRKIVSLQAFDPTMQIAPARTDGPSVWLFGGALPDELALQSVESGKPKTFPFPGLTALATNGDDLLVARGERIDCFTKSIDSADPGWKIRPIVILPDDKNEPIIGVLDVNGRLLFSTAQTIFTIQNAMVVPVIDGMGGSLYSYRGGVLVHDARTLRLFQLTGGSLVAPGQRRGGGTMKSLRMIIVLALLTIARVAFAEDAAWSTTYDQWKTALDRAEQRVPATDKSNTRALNSLNAILAKAEDSKSEIARLADSLKGRAGDISSATSHLKVANDEFESAKRDADRASQQEETKAQQLHDDMDRAGVQVNELDEEDDRLSTWSKKLDDWHNRIEAQRRPFQIPDEQAAMDEFNAQVNQHNAEVGQYNIALAAQKESIAKYNTSRDQLIETQKQITEDGKHVLELRDGEEKKHQDCDDAQAKLDELSATQTQETAQLTDLLNPSLASLQGLLGVTWMDPASR